MKATIVELIEKDNVLLNEKEISEPGPGQVQVRAAYSLISPGTERACIKQMENVAITFPFTLGYSMSGVVEKVGKDVEGYKEGDRVACLSAHRSLWNIPVDNCTKVPDGVSLQEAAFIFLGNIAMQGVRKASIELGESAVVLGLGLVGQVALQLSSLCGAVPLIGIDRVDSRLEMALNNKADFVLNTSDDNWIDKLKSLTNDKGPAAIIESTGFPEPINLAFNVAAKYGRVILLGSTRAMSQLSFYTDIHRKGLHVIGAHVSTVPDKESYSGHWTFKDNFYTFLELIKYKKVNVMNLVTDVIESHNVLPMYKRITDWDDNIVAALIKWS